jgi:hypothetical protein
MFLTLALTAMLAFLAEKAITWSPRITILLLLSLGALAATISLSAIFAMVFATIALMLFAGNKVKSVLTVIVVALFAAGLYFAFPQAGVSKYLTERIENLGSLRESSAYQHYVSVVDAEAEIAHFEPAEILVGTFQSRDKAFLPETYYLRTLYLRGALGLATLLSIIALSVYEGYRRYRAASGNPQRRGLFLAALIGVAAFAFGALFIPYFDIFPSNFYFWFLVAIIWGEPEPLPTPRIPLATLPKCREKLSDCAHPRGKSYGAQFPQ